MTFEGLRKYICEPSKTRVLAFLHVACHGLAGAGCSGMFISLNPFHIDKRNDRKNHDLFSYLYPKHDTY